MRVAIIEDELLSQQELKSLLTEIDVSVEVKTCLRSVSESLSWLRVHHQSIDLVFADIELLDGQSFEVFEKVDMTTPVIFLTAYDQYAIQAFKVNSIDYLLKPLEKEELKRALRKYDKLREDNKFYQNLARLLENSKHRHLNRIRIKCGDAYEFVELKDVAFFYSDDKTTYLVTFLNKVHIIDYSLNEIQELIDPGDFFRVSRKYLVKINSIEKASKYFNSRLKLTLNLASPDDIIISRVKVPEFLDWMGTG